MTDSLAKLAQDMREMYNELLRMIVRLDALAAQQVPESAWRQAIIEHWEEWGSPTHVKHEVAESIERRALELSSGSGEDR